MHRGGRSPREAAAPWKTAQCLPVSSSVTTSGDIGYTGKCNSRDASDGSQPSQAEWWQERPWHQQHSEQVWLGHHGLLPPSKSCPLPLQDTGYSSPGEVSTRDAQGLPSKHRAKIEAGIQHVPAQGSVG